MIEIAAFEISRREIEANRQVHVLRATVDQQRGRLGQHRGRVHAAAGQLLDLFELEDAAVVEDAIQVGVQAWADGQRIWTREAGLSQHAHALNHVAEGATHAAPVAHRQRLSPFGCAQPGQVER